MTAAASASSATRAAAKKRAQAAKPVKAGKPKGKAKGKRGNPRAVPGELRPLTAMQSRFVDEFIHGPTATAAAVRAGYSPKSAAWLGNGLLKLPHVQAAIDSAKDKIALRNEVKADVLLRQLLNIAMVDTRQIVNVRRQACRHCWSPGHAYLPTADEARRLREQHARNHPGNGNGDGHQFQEPAGLYDGKRGPDPTCTECAGRGTAEMQIADFSTLTPAAAATVSSVRQGRDGVEVKFYSRADASARLLAFLGVGERLDPSAALQLVADPKATLATRGQAVIGALVAGSLTVPHASSLLGGLGSLARMIEVDALEARISAIENRLRQ